MADDLGEGAIEANGNAFVPRGYQLEMLEASLASNIIVAMDTGSGKTAIAVLRIAAELERCPAHKRVWFLCPKVALAQQQHRVLKKLLSGTPSRVLVGSDGCQLWSSKTIWDEVLLNVRVVVCTPGILYDALAHAFVGMGEIALLVFDEAHYCKDNHPANQILAGFYHPSRIRGKEIPHILGLTASPVFGNKVKGLEIIEKNMDAICRTPYLNREELLRYTHQPRIIQEGFSSNTLPRPRILNSLVIEFNLESIYKDPLIQQLQNDGRTSPEKLTRTILKGQTPCREQLKTLIHAAETIHGELGPWASERYLLYTIGQFLARDIYVFCTGSSEQAEVVYLSAFFRRLDTTAEYSQPPNAQSVSDKVETLVHILQKELQTGGNSTDMDLDDGSPSSSPITGIVFVETRVVVCMLKQLLENHLMLGPHLRLGLSFGSSSHPKRKSMISDYVLKDKSIEPIEDVLDDLRLRIKNLLISTNVVEEGIDITACNTVICFDQSPNLVSFVQRRGRARDSASRYYIMFPNFKNSTGVPRWLQLEEEMKAKYMDDMRELQRLESHELAQTGHREYKVESTGARLTLHDALPHLHHFCSTLGNVRYASTVPVFTFEGDVRGGTGECRVALPTCLDSAFRNFNSSTPWPSEQLLKADAAFEACVALHKAGLLNDNLLPKRELSEEETSMYQAIEKRPNVVAVNPVFSPWLDVYQASMDSSAYLERIIVVQEGTKVVLRMRLLMAGMPKVIESFDLHIDARRTLSVSFAEIRPADNVDLELAARFTNSMLYSTFRSRMLLNEAILPIYFLPLDNIDHSWLLQEGDTHFPASILTSSPDRAGLIRDASGKTYTLYGAEEVQSFNEGTGTSITKTMIRVFPVAKRYDFLHSIPLDQRPKKEHSVLLDPDSCTMDPVPLQYAEFGSFIPSIQHKIENALLVQQLNDTVLASAAISSSALLLEAISSPASRENVNYQRIEFLGDAVFKFYTAVTLMAQHLTYPEGYLAYTKDLIVSNKSAALAAKEVGLDRFIIRANFTGTKWRPIYIKDILSMSADSKDTSTDELSTKILADVVEALIAAAYLDGHDSETKVLAVLNIFTCSAARKKITWEPLELLHSKLESEIPSLDETPLIVQQLQTMIGYTFKHPALALEALTHPGHVSVASGIGSGRSYQRLEFLGDAVLDMVVTRLIYSSERTMSVFRMHLLRTAAVNQDILGYFALRLGFDIEESELIDSSPHSSGQDSQDPMRIDYANKLPQRVATRTILLQLLRHAPSAQMTADLSKMQQRCRDLDKELQDALEHGKSYPWTLLAALAPEKLASDLIEAILGAMYIDNHGDLDICEAWISRIGILPWLQRAIEQEVKVWHPKEELGVVAGMEKVKYQMSRTPEQAEESLCTLFIGDRKICEAQGASKKIAEMRAAEIAVQMAEQDRGRGAEISNGIVSEGTNSNNEEMVDE